jgi:L-rhamnose mutarotase
MERKAFLTRLNPGYREQYIEAHKNFSPELKSRYLRAGVRSISIFLLDDQLFMYVEADSFEKLQATLVNDPVDLAWQQYVGPMKAPETHELLEIFNFQ